jgi:hypothetical protein
MTPVSRDILWNALAQFFKSVGCTHAHNAIVIN